MLRGIDDDDNELGNSILKDQDNLYNARLIMLLEMPTRSFSLTLREGQEKQEDKEVTGF